jgi:hypothetical protein
MKVAMGYVGTAYSGKDTTNEMVVDAIVNDGVRGDNVVKGVDADTCVGFRHGNLFGKKENGRVICFHLPLALEVKREYIKQQAAKGIVLSLQDLLTNSVVKAAHREGLIAIGDGYRKEIDPLYWLKRVEEIIDALTNHVAYRDFEHMMFSVTDMRYENELPHMEKSCWARGMSMLSVKMTTPLGVSLSRMKQSDAQRYAREYKNNDSERNVKRVAGDIGIDNSGTLQDLRELVVEHVVPVLKLMLL